MNVIQCHHASADVMIDVADDLPRADSVCVHLDGRVVAWLKAVGDNGLASSSHHIVAVEVDRVRFCTETVKVPDHAWRGRERRVKIRRNQSLFNECYNYIVSTHCHHRTCRDRAGSTGHDR